MIVYDNLCLLPIGKSFQTPCFQPNFAGEGAGSDHRATSSTDCRSRTKLILLGQWPSQRDFAKNTFLSKFQTICFHQLCFHPCPAVHVMDFVRSWTMVKIAPNWAKIPKLLQKNSVFRFFPIYFGCAFIFSYVFPFFSGLFFPLLLSMFVRFSRLCQNFAQS